MPASVIWSHLKDLYFSFLVKEKSLLEVNTEPETRIEFRAYQKANTKNHQAISSDNMN